MSEKLQPVKSKIEGEGIDNENVNPSLWWRGYFQMGWFINQDFDATILVIVGYFTGRGFAQHVG